MNKTVKIIIGIIIIIAAFYGGILYNKHTTAAAFGTRGAAFALSGASGGRTGFAGRGGAAGGGGFVSGQIVSADLNSITIQLMATSSTATTGSAIVFLSSSTTVSKMTMVPISSLAPGETVMVSGAKNSDGSINANSIQVRQ